MLKVCAAQEIGPAAVLLVGVILHTEDAKWYRSGVTYYNDQLMSVLGFDSWGQLDRARAKAIKAGWLHYERGSKSRAGVYWGLIPECYENMDDLPIDEGDTPGNIKGKQGIITKSEGEQGIITTSDDSSVIHPGLKRDLSTLTLNLTQEEEEPPPPPQLKFCPEDYPIPATLRNPDFEAAWVRWCSYRRNTRRNSVSKDACQLQMPQLERVGSTAAIEAIDRAIANDYTGLFPRANNTPRGKTLQTGTEEWLRRKQDRPRT